VSSILSLYYCRDNLGFNPSPYTIKQNQRQKLGSAIFRLRALARGDVSFRGSLGAGLPLEIEDLSKSCVDGIGGNVAASLFVISIADTDVALNVQDGVLSTRSQNGGDQVEVITIGVVVARNRSQEVGASSSLCEISLEVVDRLLVRGHFVIQLIITAIVDSRNSEGETSRHVNTEGELAVLTARTERDSGTDFCIIFTERNGNGSAGRVEDIVGGARRAAGSVHTQTCNVKAWGGRDRVFDFDTRRDPVCRSSESAQSEGKDSESDGEEIEHVESSA